MNSILKKKIVLLACLTSFSVLPQISFASSSTDDLSAMIETQKQVLVQLNDRKNQQELSDRITSIDKQVNDLKKQVGNYDSHAAIDSLTAQVSAIQEQISQQVEAQNKLIDEIKELKESQKVPSISPDEPFFGTAATKNFLVNPGPSPSVGYTQDAINAQGDSTMVFSYSPTQLYKIYCKVGYLTDLQFKKGEAITYVGGGDTSKWAIDKSEIDGIPHMYIKPINPNSTTNIIVNTTKHSYQIIANTSDWYNPMVSWSYAAEDIFAAQQQQQRDDRTYTANLGVNHVEDLNFGYEIKGNADWKPSRVFDDGDKTYIQFERMSKKAPMLYIKEARKKGISLVNYRIKDNYYIVDKVFKQAELRLNDENITITAKSK